MRSFFQAVAVGCSASSQPSPSIPRRRSRSGTGNISSGGGALGADRLAMSVVPPGPLVTVTGSTLPDLASIAAATEPGILLVEEEARSLETLGMPEALALLRKWSQSLRKKPRPDESLASFRALFLRSNALEKALDALRKNTPLRQQVMDQPLFAPPGKKDKNDELAEEFQKLLQLCLPRPAAPLAELTMQALLSETPDDAAPALAVLRILKEEWTDVVQGQIMRGLEYRIDSLDYEQQKRAGVEKGPRGTIMKAARIASRERVRLLAQLCKAISEAHENAEGRSVSLSASLAPLVQEAMERPTQLGRGTGACAGLSSQRSSSKPCPSVSGQPPLPSAADCEAAVLAILSRTHQGIVIGLRLLGLPDSPLVFVPGEELRLCGLDVRKPTNTMLAHWVQEERDEFYVALRELREFVRSASSAPTTPARAGSVVGLPVTPRVAGLPMASLPLFTPPRRPSLGSPTGDAATGGAAWAAGLRAEREEALRERSELRKRLESIEDRLKEIDASLASYCPPADNSPGSSQQASSPGMRNSTGSQSSPALPKQLTKQSSMPSLPARPLHPIRRSSSAASNGLVVAAALEGDFDGMVSAIADALASDTQRGVERLAAQLQQRRTQLVAGLSAHLSEEERQMSSLVTDIAAPSESVAAMGAALQAREELTMVLREAQDLCDTVASVVGHDCSLDREGSEATLRSGTRCQARWMDGRYYDATVQTVLGDGSAVVNWLRPRPSDDGSPDRQPLVTVSESGGDDTLHRIVPKEDIRVSMSSGVCSDELVAQRFFETRPQPDFSCAECRAGGSADWASVSFGIYLCRSCASLHQAVGVRASVVKPLGGGWGWMARDLAYMRNGGNAAYHECLQGYPAVAELGPAERCGTRFAEYYRRQLDALCVGVQAPPNPTPEAAAAPSAGDFLSAAEAAAAVADAANGFQERARVIFAKNPAMLPL